jgi:hypothetical protein
MARCPRCGKKFKDDGRVLRHMVQPHSACREFAHHLVRISRKINLEPKRRQEQPISPPLNHPAVSNFDMFVDIPDSPPLTPDNFEDVNTEQPPADLDASLPFVEQYANASEIHGRGSTFMDQFYQDKHSQHRADNIFYPFASKQDWEIASWMVRSNLSMAIIDEFLSIELVCLFILSNDSQFLLPPRFGVFHYLSVLPTNFAVVLRCCHQDRNGHVNLGLHQPLQNLQ